MINDPNAWNLATLMGESPVAPIGAIIVLADVVVCLWVTMGAAVSEALRTIKGAMHASLRVVLVACHRRRLK